MPSLEDPASVTGCGGASAGWGRRQMSQNSNANNLLNLQTSNGPGTDRNHTVT